MRSTLGLLAILCAAGCQDACWMDDYTFVRYGEHVTVYGYGVTEADACAGSFDALDAHVGMVKELLWADESERYGYRWLSDEYWGEVAPCSTDAFACENQGRGGAFSRMYPDMHESVHAVVGPIGCPKVLDEGLAMYLDGPNPRSWVPSNDLIPRLLTAQDLENVREYAAAGHFSAFLVERHGWGTVVALCMEIGREGTIVDWELAVGRYLDMPLTQMIDEYRAFPACSTQEYRARIFECESEPDFTFSGGRKLFSVRSDCLDPLATNAAWGYLGNAVVTRRVYFPEDTAVVVSVFADGDSGTPATFMAEQCAPCSADPQVVTLDEGRSTVEFRSGLHTVSVFFDKRDAVRLDMSASD